MSVFYYQLPTFALILPMRFSTALLAAEKPNLHAVADMFILVCRSLSSAMSMRMNLISKRMDGWEGPLALRTERASATHSCVRGCI